MDAYLHACAVGFSDIVIQLLICIIIDSCFSRGVRIGFLHTGCAGSHRSVCPLLHGANTVKIMAHSGAEGTVTQKFIDILSGGKRDFLINAQRKFFF